MTMADLNGFRLFVTCLESIKPSTRFEIVGLNIESFGHSEVAMVEQWAAASKVRR
jgi:hypothetical protein